MSILPRDLSKVDREFLVDLSTRFDSREKLQFELKRSVNLSTQEAKQEFLFDVSSFANSVGGDILIGVAEDPRDPGKMGEIVGVEGKIDRFIQQLEDAILNHCNPRLVGVDFHSISLGNSLFAIVIRVPRSYRAPHMVTINGTYRFYGRKSTGKVLLSTQEIRDLVLSSDSFSDKLRRFKLTRASSAYSQSLPVEILPLPCVLMHLIPEMSLASGNEFEIGQLIQVCRQNAVMPPGTGGMSWKPAFEGAVHTSDHGRSGAYTLLFREGIFEGVSTFEFDVRKLPTSLDVAVGVVWDQNLLEITAEWMHRCQLALLELGLQPPHYASVQLLGIEGHYLGTILHERGGPGPNIRQQNLDLRELSMSEILDLDQWRLKLKPIFDRLANAWGLTQSNLY